MDAANIKRSDFRSEFQQETDKMTDSIESEALECPH
jgi:hypothetical protein